MNDWMNESGSSILYTALTISFESTATRFLASFSRILRLIPLFVSAKKQRQATTKMDKKPNAICVIFNCFLCLFHRHPHCQHTQEEKMKTEKAAPKMGKVAPTWGVSKKEGRWISNWAVSVTTIELVVTTVDSVRDSKSERTFQLPNEEVTIAKPVQMK